MRGLCYGASPWDLSSPCIRLSYSAVLPTLVVAAALLAAIIRLPQPLKRILSPLNSFLTLPEAEALLSPDQKAEVQRPQRTSLWPMVILSLTALLETLVWIVLGSYLAVVEAVDLWHSVLPFLIASSWLYASCRPILSPTATPPYDLLVLYTTRIIFDTLVFGGILYDKHIYGIPLPTPLFMAALALNLTASVVSLVTMLSMPVAIPSACVDPADIGKSVSPEDYTSLWGWVSFHWVKPLITRGTNTTLQEADVWNLSPTMQSRAVYIKFCTIKRATLLRRLWAANSLDLILDFTLTYVSIVFNYLGPFFLKRILDSLDTPDNDTEQDRNERLSLAYIYALLAFLSTLAKAEADVQHLWFGRRASTRIKASLMTSIYDKALKRKDFSGIVDKNGAAKKGPEQKGKHPKADDPKAGADVGKIVNLMAGDANRVAQMVSGAYFIYGAPFEIIIASVFLYQLLGLSAFAGFFVLLIGWPLNNFVARRAVRIQKGLSSSRDKRMGVLNELITAVKFIKFFAWEDRWIQRVLDAREVELQWLVKARVNSICFSLIWTTAPIAVSVTAFFTYVVQGNQLTVGTAFTAIALFGMLRAPLNVIPAWIVQILQTGVALNRIATYLDEDEVDEQVSTLKKRSATTAEGVAPGLGIHQGTFKWNEVEEQKAKEHGTEASNGASEDDVATVVDSASVAESEASERRFQLTDITIMFPERELTVITGPTASGKTALLMALLGEMTLLEGRLIMSKDTSVVDEHGLQHAISYAAQSPWLRHQSIKDNILFGYPYDEERYNAVTECCALLPDLQMLEDGDATEIGARGVSLSGGQKARVALARAIYAPTQYVLLDDPLSAVDSHTARFLFEKLLQGPLLANRTVILVTHHVELVLPGAFYLVRMLDGRIDTHGTVKDLRARGVLEEITHDESVAAHKDEQQAAKEAPHIDPATADDPDAPQEKAKKPRKLIEEEKREQGSVKWNIYRTYLKASSYWTWGLLTLIIVCNQGLAVGEKLWIEVWGGAYKNSTVSFIGSYALRAPLVPDHEVTLDPSYMSVHFTHASAAVPSTSMSGKQWPSAQEHPYFYIGIYASITLAVAVLNVLGAVIQYTGALRASRKLFKQLLVAVVRATMRWHDVTPQGRMLNRFSKDVETVDSSLSGTLQTVNSSLANFAASVITVVVIFPLFIFPAVVIGFIYRQLAIGYLNTGRDLRRMESNTRSPIFANFGELLEGIVTVRAFSAEQLFLDNHTAKVDLTNKMWYTFWMTNRWLLLHFDALGALGVWITTLFALAGFVNAGRAGVCITSAMSFTNSVYWACRFWTALELDLNSVERVVEYLDLPQEAPAVIESSRPPAYWPSSSSSNADSLISVEDLVIRYAPELPPVLHGVSFKLKAKERIGLLGRTGSGKSTLAMSVLRFVDPASGRILIDGIDISTIGLHDLRSRITFIPQDATLFSGTLRDNLDPFSEHEDNECLDVLYRVHMLTDSQHASQRASRETSRAASRGPSRPGSIHEVEREESVAPSNVSLSATETESKVTITLDTQVSAGGTNFSQGQRQLIAMARALLRRSSIIVLDEATSSIDFATDAKIQTAIREEFNDSLLLTVAHRLRTVIDYDRLIVLDKGQLVEFDTPYNLIQKEGGIFRSMCLKSGTFAELEAAAKAKADSLNQ
ncbi:multidrug resistance-associated ABC transporter [Cytidiella melzeri]|nr:multidrug resistance-associated ABC transporter [Cytidiella melzeri]